MSEFAHTPEGIASSEGLPALTGQPSICEAAP